MGDKLLTPGMAAKNKGYRGTNAYIVQDSQTIQSVIDDCPVAVGSLKGGFTNPWLIKVPPGHESEFYSLVRDASDDASDKRNVKVVFEDNPEGKFQIDLIDDFVEDWTASYDGVVEFVKSDYMGYDNCLHVYGDGAGTRLMARKTFSPALDLSKYQGFLVDVCFPQPKRMGQENNFKCGISYDSEYSRNLSTLDNDMMGEAPLRTTLFIPFSTRFSTTAIDLSSINTIFFDARLDANDSPGDFYISNLRAIRTSQTPIAIIRVDDGCPYAIDLFPQIIEKGWGASVSMYRGYGVRAGDQDYLSLAEARGLQAHGFEFVNETRDHPYFNDIDKTQTLYQHKSNQQFLRQYGFAQAANILLNPYHNTNGWLVEKLKQDGGIQYSGLGEFPSSILFISEAFSTTQMGYFLADDQGGVATLMNHFAESPSAELFGTFLDYIETHFSHVILATDLLKRFPENVYKYRVPEVDYDYARVETIAADMKFYNMDGGTFKITASAGSLSLIPTFEFETRQLKVINDGTNSFTFDPTFTAAGTHDGDAEAETLEDSGESWSIGQLVGRTVNNITDGSSGEITDNTGTEVPAVLSGGTNNYWSVGDNYTITPPGVNQAIGEDQIAIFSYDGEGWNVISLYDKSP